MLVVRVFRAADAESSQCACVCGAGRWRSKACPHHESAAQPRAARHVEHSASHDTGSHTCHTDDPTLRAALTGRRPPARAKTARVARRPTRARRDMVGGLNRRRCLSGKDASLSLFFLTEDPLDLRFTEVGGVNGRRCERSAGVSAVSAVLPTHHSAGDSRKKMEHLSFQERSEWSEV